MTPEPELRLCAARPDEPAVRAVLERHIELMQQSSPEESCHVMPPDRLLETGARLLTLREGDRVLGVGALTDLGNGHGELKSMHTVAEARGRGVARRILSALIDLAREEGMTRLSLETGSAAQFEPARALYAAHGFETCAPFGGYVSDPYSVFMTSTL